MNNSIFLYEKTSFFSIIADNVVVYDSRTKDKYHKR